MTDRERLLDDARSLLKRPVITEAPGTPAAWDVRDILRRLVNELEEKRRLGF